MASSDDNSRRDPPPTGKAPATGGAGDSAGENRRSDSGNRSDGDDGPRRRRRRRGRGARDGSGTERAGRSSRGDGSSERSRSRGERSGGERRTGEGGGEGRRRRRRRRPDGERSERPAREAGERPAREAGERSAREAGERSPSRTSGDGGRDSRREPRRRSAGSSDRGDAERADGGSRRRRRRRGQAESGERRGRRGRGDDGERRSRRADDDFSGSGLLDDAATEPPHLAARSDSEDEALDALYGSGRREAGGGEAGDDASDAERIADPDMVHLAALVEASAGGEYDDPPEDDLDPVTHGIEAIEVDERESLDTSIRNLVGVKFGSAGRIILCDGGNATYHRGEDVVIEGERGIRIGTVAIDSVRRPHRGKSIKKVLRRPNRSDQRTMERNDERSTHALGLARDAARRRGLPIKVFRAAYTHSGNKVLIYFTAEQRIDFRDLVRELSGALRGRVEMRQTGVRDEAKMTGGIGSCGRELCCTTWLPEFVPVSIKMAKDQGLVLNPTKVSGQCGRLKCCLVYEQATYAQLRKGLPKLGKRVITEAGEGRVVEVDVLRQRVRVSFGPGEFQVFPGNEVKPLFPSQPQRKPKSPR